MLIQDGRARPVVLLDLSFRTIVDGAFRTLGLKQGRPHARLDVLSIQAMGTGTTEQTHRAPAQLHTLWAVLCRKSP